MILYDSGVTAGVTMTLYNSQVTAGVTMTLSDSVALAKLGSTLDLLAEMRSWSDITTTPGD